MNGKRFITMPLSSNSRDHTFWEPGLGVFSTIRFAFAVGFLEFPQNRLDLAIRFCFQSGNLVK